MTIGASAVLMACSSGTNRPNAGYCTKIAATVGQLNAPAITSSADIDATLALYRAIEATAPNAIDLEWKAMVTNLETAATMNPDDLESRQKVADSARQVQPSADAIIQFTRALCGTQIGPAPTVAPPTLLGSIPPNT